MTLDEDCQFIEYGRDLFLGQFCIQDDFTDNGGLGHGLFYGRYLTGGSRFF